MLFTPQKASLFQFAVPEKRHYFQISFLTKHTYFLGLLGLYDKKILYLNNFAVQQKYVNM